MMTKLIKMKKNKNMNKNKNKNNKKLQKLKNNIFG